MSAALATGLRCSEDDGSGAMYTETGRFSFDTVAGDGISTAKMEAKLYEF